MKISRANAALAAMLGSVLAVRAIARRARRYPIAGAVAFVTPDATRRRCSVPHSGCANAERTS
ncbi:MAG TPA: hypothetical protein VGZ02_00585 [Candidatus Baltobacteraceae bacterium]|nr:hypothetical protein [Candidatus Baltobacteraceae bacterium]